jgi:hypothetical protein
VRANPQHAPIGGIGGDGVIVGIDKFEEVTEHRRSRPPPYVRADIGGHILGVEGPHQMTVPHVD